MDIKLTNTLTREKEIFKPIKPNKVGIYCCGPTVYLRASIGNFRSYIFWDILRRVFELNGYDVKHVMNITDVGHLTDDASEGEDKIEKTAAATEKSVWDISKEYTDLFLSDMKKLNIKAPTVMPKATDHIPEQVALIEDLEEKNFTYQISDGIYFDTSKLNDYGKLSGQKLEEKKEGARVEKNIEKKNSTDFALWKFSPKGQKRQMEWNSKWGIGFPGWHIECSAMSEKYLGVPFDIHTGGIDHIPVHHTNEIAQTEAVRAKPLANYWLHNEFLMVDNGKMSKSLGNTYSLDDLKEKGFEPLSYRYFLLVAHYRNLHNFTWDGLRAAQNTLNKLRNQISELADGGRADQDYIDRFLQFINDDLDIASALSLLWEVMNDKNLEDKDRRATILKFDEIFGLGLSDIENEKLEVPVGIQDLLNQRKQARDKEDWSKSDQIRDQISDFGFEVKDTENGQELRKK